MEPLMVHLLALGSDDKLVTRVAQGLGLVAEHVAHLQRSVETLARAKEPRGVATVRAVADEEAAKYLILVGAVRCPGGAEGQTPPTHLLRSARPKGHLRRDGRDVPADFADRGGWEARRRTRSPLISPQACRRLEK